MTTNRLKESIQTDIQQYYKCLRKAGAASSVLTVKASKGLYVMLGYKKDRFHHKG